MHVKAAWPSLQLRNPSSLHGMGSHWFGMAEGNRLPFNFDLRQEKRIAGMEKYNYMPITNKTMMHSFKLLALGCSSVGKVTDYLAFTKPCA